MAQLFDLTLLADGLELGPDGIWVARELSTISYPQEGNLNCLALEADSFWFAHRNRCIQTLLSNFPPGGVFFDVGGGNGYVALGLQAAGFPVALLEPGWQGIQAARSRGVQVLIYAALEDAGFHPDALPAVGMFDVLEHISNDVGFLGTVRDLLAPGGRVYLTVPAFQQLWSVDDDYAGHYRRYSRASLGRVLGEAGFEVEFSTYIFFMLPAPIFLMRTLPAKLGLRKKESWDRYQQEHGSQPGWVGRVLDLLLDWELAQLHRRRAMPVGGSCLVVARRT